ncbi:sugar/nucleoside kinase (ribokinase family) [Nocardia transvalensis]|uniref:Sugar/nucleoside kinase (Ribokinase family) n=1 Tax=Nocardia transvalensis TaxID=37333 RepID=A0A7W9PC42_9NOCA|nr:PfkB family carbohydrate kinase [Nocardia transvalensis]MBB5913359.1 sugar/nucleoside kinase (ribokinase family) [Nocardia transvalensis]
MATAVFVGLATLDIAYAVRRYPAEDSKTQADDQFLGAGGPAANAAVTYAHLSGRTPALITALGDHQLAQVIRRDLDEYGVAPLDVTPGGTHRPPVSSIVVATEAGSRTIVSLDGSEISAPFDREHTGPLNDATVVLLDGHYPELALGFASAARKSGVTVVLDAGRWRPVHAELLPMVDIAICSSAFAPPHTGGTPGEVVDDLRARGVPRVAITEGGGPVRYADPDGRGEIAVRDATIVDTLGAGDILHGAFCHYYCAGHSFSSALRDAAAVATASCGYLGTREWMRRTPFGPAGR